MCTAVSQFPSGPAHRRPRPFSRGIGKEAHREAAEEAVEGASLRIALFALSMLWVLMAITAVISLTCADLEALQC